MSDTENNSPEEIKPPDWMTDLNAVEREDWYTALPEDVRPKVKLGIESRAKAWEKGFNQKFQEFSTHRKTYSERERAWEQEKQELVRRASLFDSLMTGDDDPRIKDYETKVKEYETKLAEVASERDTYRTKYSEWEQREVEREADRFIASYGDIVGDEKAFGKMNALMSTGQFTEEEAAGVVRGMFDLKQEAKPLPKHMQLASPGGGPKVTHAPAGDEDEGDDNLNAQLARAAARAARKLGIND